MGASGWHWLKERALAWHRMDDLPSGTAAAAFDEFDRRMRLSIILAYLGGSLTHLLVALLAPTQVYGGQSFALGMVVLGVLSGIGIALLPWRRFGRDLFAIVFIHAALLIAGLIYSTGGPDSPFNIVFLLITISTGLYNSTRLAMGIAGFCATLGFLPLLYAQTTEHFLLQQTALSVCVLASAAFNRLIVPELLRRTRAEQALQDDLRETRLLRDELARANALLATQAHTDTLTGLPNRAAIFAQLDAAFARHTATGAPCSVIFFDIDRFKRVNDTHGHRAGDAVLRHVARLLDTTPTVGGHGGRYGGEEFLIVLDGATEDEALLHAEILRALIAATPCRLPDGTELALTVSVGVASAPTHGAHPEAILHAADEALYRAKAGGRNRVCAADTRDAVLMLELAELAERAHQVTPPR